MATLTEKIKANPKTAIAALIIFVVILIALSIIGIITKIKHDK